KRSENRRPEQARRAAGDWFAGLKPQGMAFGNRAGVLEVNVRVVQRRRGVADLGAYFRDRSGRDERDRQRYGNGGKKRTNAQHGMGAPALSVGGFYKDAPRLPDGDRVDVRSLVTGAWVEIEVGPGRGWFVVERAQVEPQAALVGVEI